MRSGVFLERDGILNVTRLERNSPCSPRTMEEFEVKMEAVEPLRRLKAAGYILLVTTNQPGVSRGYVSRRELDLMHGQLKRRLPIDEILVCPHDETDRCPCRKPKPGLLQEGAFSWHLDLDRSFVISDKWQDAQAAHVLGCTSLLLRSPWIGTGHRDFILPDLESAVQKILQMRSADAALVG